MQGINKEEFLILHHSESGTGAQMNLGVLMASPVAWFFLKEAYKNISFYNNRSFLIAILVLMLELCSTYG